MIDVILTAVITGVVTGALSTFGTVKALHVHISYLREIAKDHSDQIQRAHARIDELTRS